MKTAAFLYPWDVVGDPGATARIADLGVQQVTLASAYHSTRALTPRHPRHRVVTAAHAAVLYPVDEERWSGQRLRPYAAGDWAPGADPYGEAAEALAAAGLDVHSWVVLAHNSRLGADFPDTSVVNAYGDRYPWAPCIARADVRAYLTRLAAEAAVRPGARGTELESCGWYGLAHLHAHDKIAGVGLGDAAQYLMSLCFCPGCEAGYAGLGSTGEELRAAVRRALEPAWASGRSSGAGWPAVEKLIGTEAAAVTLAWRTRTARTLQESAVAAVRAAAPPGFQVLLHADPSPYHCGANAGVDPGHVLGVADGVVVPCADGPELLAPFVERLAPGAATVVAANLGVVSGMGGSPGTLAADAARAAARGASELRLYHAGLASDADLGLVRAALRP
ncbi:hypothetical protein AR457_26445 [Streptomyces agglomeratus]|uniref:Alanine-rich protein n=1 Tax=Streptomyces agglomeratus TaxID=285458 RepID=A0A1E5PD77_9ACTN|nr:hypothetical protein [Streptomyces agglomeratus]OEJ27476.1 hypothetical protein AS594_26320 [Streptomyces agglomeratus]OEJ38467.1 hypothetical protein BGK70_10210 [Streptomyces agglomeratus]OEJ47148.1 hypothetical protein AR457_26445 [Streptomyces agglomeratus]OEJ50995.1 hypothetical protein BGK72_09695 [Streptomyces agglomeratus]OEJ58365.1 hypothetical protein BGM19_10605 [Streptomyces agglomeratus]